MRVSKKWRGDTPVFALRKQTAIFFLVEKVGIGQLSLTSTSERLCLRLFSAARVGKKWWCTSVQACACNQRYTYI